MSTTTYRRVSSAEPNDDEDNYSNSTFRSIQRRSSPSDRLTDKAIALAWVLVAAAVAKYTKFFHILFVDDNGTEETAGDSKSLRTPNRTLLQVCALCFVTNTVLLLYLTVYLPRFKGLTDSSAWEVYCPRVVPTMTIVGILFGLIMIRATWPVWGFLSPLILGIELMGFLFALHFLPWPFG